MSAASSTPDLEAINKLMGKDGKAGGESGVAELAKQLGAMQEQMKALQAQLKATEVAKTAAEEIASAARIAYSRESLDDTIVNQNVQKLMKASGWTEEQIKAAFAAAQEESDEPPARGGKKEEPVARPLREDQDFKVLQDVTQRRILRDIKDQVVSALDANPNIKASLAFIEKRDGADAAKKLRDSWVTDAVNAARSDLKADIDRKAHIDLDWFEEGPKKAVSSVADRVRAYLGDPKHLGRMQPIVAGEDPFAELEKKPVVPRPKWTEELATGTVEQQAGDRITDSLMRAAAKATSETADI
jgi:hypothetical protein